MSIFQIWNDSVHRNLLVIIVRIRWQDEQDYILENNCSMNKYRVYHVIFIVVCGQWRLSIKKAVKKILDRFFLHFTHPYHHLVVDHSDRVLSSYIPHREYCLRAAASRVFQF